MQSYEPVPAVKKEQRPRSGAPKAKHGTGVFLPLALREAESG